MIVDNLLKDEVESKPLYKISQKDIAGMIGKTPSAVSYIKRHNANELEILKLGVACKKLGVKNVSDLYKILSFYKLVKNID